MRITTINKLAAVMFGVLLLNINSVRAEVLPYLSLYGEPKYTALKNFDYVNPNAPKGGRIVLPAYGGFDSFNPFIFKGVPAYEAAGLTLDTLAVVPSDDISTAYPLVAEKFDLAPDHSYIGFILNPKAQFHDGSKITADDVIFSFNSLVEKGSPLYKIYYSDVERVEKINDNEVRFYFKPQSQNKELPLILAQLPVLSAKYWEGKDFAKPELKPMLTSGPYKVSKFEPGKFVVLERVKDYWAQNLPSRKGFFNFDEVRYDYYQDTTVTLQALFAGNIDLREEYIAKIWVTGYDNEQVKNGNIKKEEIAHNNTAILQSFVFNLRRPQFQDKRVRQAIGLAFNFEWANQNLFYNQYRRLDSYFSNSEMAATGKPQGKELSILKQFAKDLPPEVFGELPPPPYHADYRKTREYLKQAVALLKEAGYDFVDVRDVASGCLLAAEKGRKGECYILSDKYCEIREVLDIAGEVSGKKKLPVLPLWMAKLAAPFMQLHSRRKKQRPLYTAYSLHVLGSGERFSHKKATEELGYSPRDLRLTIRDMVADMQGTFV